MKMCFCALVCCVLLLFLCHGQGEETTEALFPALGENGKMGYINAQGVFVIPPQFDVAGDFRGSYAPVRLVREAMSPEEEQQYGFAKSCEGIIDRTGRFVLPPEYDLDEGYDGYYYGGKDTGIVLVYRWKDTVYGVDEEGEETVAPSQMGFFDIPTGCFSGLKWDAVWPWCSESRLIAVIDGEGLAGYASRDTGEMVIPCQFHAVDPCSFSEGVAAVAYDDEDWNPKDYFLIDETGAEIPLPEGIHASYHSFASEGLIQIVNDENAYGYADLRGRVVIPPQFAYAQSFSGGKAWVEFQEGDWGLILRDGSVVSRGFSGEGFGGLNTENGVVIQQRDKNTFAALTEKGEELFSLTLENLVNLHPPMENGLCWFDTDSSGHANAWIDRKKGLVDLEGNIVSPAQWLTLEYDHPVFSQGLEPVLSRETGKWGYLNGRGEVALPVQYDKAYPFENGLAWVCLGNRCGYIDLAGNEIYFWEAEAE